jgi:hypothetical protein
VVDHATRDLNVEVYERIGLSEKKRNQLIELLAELRASGHEFDVERSEQLIDDLGSRQARKAKRNGGKSRAEVA